MADEHGVPDAAEDDDRGLVARYEQLRTVAVGRDAGGAGHGLALFAARGMAAWMAAWRSLRPSPPPVPAATGPVADDVVVVLAAMAAACLAGR